jgi:uncharacterized protein (DUF952 family)
MLHLLITIHGTHLKQLIRLKIQKTDKHLTIHVYGNLYLQNIFKA